MGDKAFRGKDHSSSRKKASKERTLERSEEGAEIGCNGTQNQQFNTIWPEKALTVEFAHCMPMHL